MVLYRRGWLSIFDELLNVENGKEAGIVAEGGNIRVPVLGTSNVNDITKEEGREAVEGIKVKKAPGLGGIAADWLKRGGY